MDKIKKIAFVFSGQGSQYTGMGKELTECSVAAKQVFDLSDSIRSGTSTQCFTAPKEELSLTINTQPCLYSVDLAAAEALREAGIIPDCVAGFSLGEVAALTFAGVFTQQDGFTLVCKRAELMHQAAQKTEAGMAAVLKLTNQQVEDLCKEFENVFPVNYNCNGQLVVAGEKNALDLFIKAIAAQGGRAVPLAVSGCFHSPLMQSAADGLYQELANFKINTPLLPVYSNVTAEVYSQDIRKVLSLQIKSPVLWQKTIEHMLQAGVETFIEVGAGTTLSGLIKRIAPQAVIYNVEDKASLDRTLESYGGNKPC